MKNQTVFDLASAKHVAGEIVDAAIAYREMLAADPDHVEALHYLGVVLHQQGDTAESIEMILRALQLDASSPERYNDLGNILTENGRFAEARQAFSAALELNATDANLWNNLGSVLHRLNEFPEAETAYRNAVSISPNFVPALNNLAALLAEQNQVEESSFFACRAYVQPPLTDKPLKMLGIAYYRLGLVAEAADCYRSWLDAEPDNPLARHHLVACTGQDIPAKATDRYLISLFNDMAENFDTKLVGKLGYCGPDIVGNLLNDYLTANANLSVLDGGCGTGLCAPVLKPYARLLTGVDISSRMLGKAAERALYDVLVESELTSYLKGKQQSFDLITMADTLVYFGNLSDIFALVRQALLPLGTFCFTVESASSVEASLGYQLNASGRYSHSKSYLTELLNAHDFILLQEHEANIRHEFGKPTLGMGFLTQIAR
ncbi:tetratricopeptide repeat protein [Methylomonas sp. LW13]|uniref:tetratricopeptide repeat protein n=1 Tax=unclassified Methylomonas TaxID=2608980 RepID=UPI00068B2961|nr:MULTISPECIES: tetratricopeptide repeat protein [unclassified Methylomonas]PKD39652.1 methyltransferase [Methylomonas sp. Kb3]QBC27747.1 tetratricopeptide repeat protein [Methylomonas sp. LW13]